MTLLAERYAEMRPAARVRERALFPIARTPSELEIQARWFAGEFGTRFTSTAGDKVEIVQFGTWNREAGPDFRAAAVRINEEEARLGCIEIDLTDQSWETHGHATNPAFDDTVLHVFVEGSGRTFFTRTTSNRNVPQVRIDLSALADKFSLNVPLARSGRCHGPLRELPEDRVQGVLEAAARFRMQKKAARLQNNADVHGRDDALFQEIAAALGYKENKLPFTLIAQRLPLPLLRENKRVIEALLFGIAGFLETPDLGVYRESTREYVRALWHDWWPHREGAQRLILPRNLWRITGTRPTNHPQRRLAALGQIVSHWAGLRRILDQPSATAVRDYFRKLEHPFWNRHYTLTSEPAAKSMALAGDSRVAEMLANIFFPLWFGQGADIWRDYAHLPARLTNRRVETAAARLFGPDPRRPQFMQTVAQQQGLLQIYEDFCLQDNSDCAECPFPEQMAKWI